MLPTNRSLSIPEPKHRKRCLAILRAMVLDAEVPPLSFDHQGSPHIQNSDFSSIAP